MVTRVKTAGKPLAQPDAEPNEVIPINSPEDFNTNGPPESPLQVDTPPVVPMQMLPLVTVVKYVLAQTALVITGTVAYCNWLVTPLAESLIRPQPEAMAESPA